MQYIINLKFFDISNFKIINLIITIGKCKIVNKKRTYKTEIEEIFGNNMSKNDKIVLINNNGFSPMNILKNRLKSNVSKHKDYIDLQSRLNSFDHTSWRTNLYQPKLILQRQVFTIMEQML